VDRSQLVLGERISVGALEEALEGSQAGPGEERGVHRAV